MVTLLNLLYKHLRVLVLMLDLCSWIFHQLLTPFSHLFYHFNLDAHLVNWIVDFFLTCRSQRVNGFLSEQHPTSTSSPQDCVLSLCSRHILKLSDDTVITVMIITLLQNDEAEHGPVVDEFVKWCDVCKNGQRRLKLHSFNVDWKLMSLFYKSFIESILTVSHVAWFSNLKVRDKNNMRGIVKVAG